MSDALSRALADLMCADTVTETETVLRWTEWAESEIEQAMGRHPDHADRIWHSFSLVVPTCDLVTFNETVYRTHCRELLERIAAAEETRLATAAECLPALREASRVAPMNPTGFGLYMRLREKASLPPVLMDGVGEHYEAIRGAAIDDAEHDLRTRLARPNRVLPGVIRHRALCPAPHEDKALP